VIQQIARIKLFDPSNLVPRWKLQLHPLYNEALRQLELQPSENAGLYSPPDRSLSSQVLTPGASGIGATQPRGREPASNSDLKTYSVDLYNKIRFPEKPQHRFANLQVVAMEIVRHASGASSHVYKLAMLKLRDVQNELKYNATSESAAGDSSIMSIGSPREKERKKGKRPRSDAQNLSPIGRSGPPMQDQQGKKAKKTK